MNFLETENLVLRNWQANDRDLFHEINCDAEVMKYFPFRRDEKQSARLQKRLMHRIDQNGYGFCAIELKHSGECAGFCGLENTEIENVFPKGTIEIGWRLAQRFWGRGIVTEASHAWLQFGFNDKGFNEVVSMAVYNNLRSIAVMKRLGMHLQPEQEFMHPSVPDSHPHLKRHVVYTLTADQWAEGQKKGGVTTAPDI